MTRGEKNNKLFRTLGGGSKRLKPRRKVFEKDGVSLKLFLEQVQRQSDAYQGMRQRGSDDLR
jgi:hypothetical protein